jgi:hypothetical protein
LARFIPWLASIAITAIYLFEIKLGWADLNWNSNELLIKSILAHLYDWVFFAFFFFFSLLGVRDLVQSKHALLRNYPVIGHIRFFLKISALRFANT